MEMSFCNSDAFQVFLDEFSKENPEEFKIILLDNGAFHKAAKLKIPTNICLLFIPPYSPELNPAEKIWWRMKRTFSGKLHKTLDEVSAFIDLEAQRLTKETVRSICGYEYITNCPFWTNSY